MRQLPSAVALSADEAAAYARTSGREAARRRRGQSSPGLPLGTRTARTMASSQPSRSSLAATMPPPPRRPLRRTKTVSRAFDRTLSPSKASKGPGPERRRASRPPPGTSRTAVGMDPLGRPRAGPGASALALAGVENAIERYVVCHVGRAGHPGCLVLRCGFPSSGGTPRRRRRRQHRETPAVRHSGCRIQANAFTGQTLSDATTHAIRRSPVRSSHLSKTVRVKATRENPDFSTQLAPDRQPATSVAASWCMIYSLTKSD